MQRPPRSNGCCDWHETQRTTPVRPPGLVPIPEEALEVGAERFAADGLTRRDALRTGVGIWVACSAAAALSPRQILEAAVEQAAAAPNANILVSLYLNGGNDGLNTLVPLEDPRYPNLRPRVRIAGEDTLPLHDTTEFGWHPSLPNVSRLYDDGKVAVMPAVDYAKPDLSHFNSVAFWRTGIAGPSRVTTGWLGRTLDVSGSRVNPLQGVSVTWGFDPVLNSRRAPTAAIYNPQNFNFGVSGVWDDDRMRVTYRRAATAKSRAPALAASRAIYRQALAVEDALRPLREEAPPTPVAYPDGGPGPALRSLARMLGAGLGTRIAAIDSGGGYDTHDDQPGPHARLLGELDASLNAWQADLEARGLADRVLTLVWSEFGRRPADNESNGTDHGAGGLVMVVGNRANGGIRSEFPGLARLDRDDNLLVTTEFRTVYASLLEQWMGVEAGRVLPRMNGARLPLVSAA